MIDESRIGIYEYIEGLLQPVTMNVYLAAEPQELNTSDTTEGFIVIELGDMYDESEFKGEAYGVVRAFVTAYVPTISRGRLNKELFKRFEDGINQAIETASVEDNQGQYWIDEESVISMDDFIVTNANNAYHAFVRSFLVMINGEAKNPQRKALYIGYGASSIATMQDIEALGGLQTYEVYEPQGDYTIDIPDYAYLWVCSENHISGLEANGFEIPCESPITIGTLLCYRTSNAIMDDSMQFTIT